MHIFTKLMHCWLCHQGLTVVLEPQENVRLTTWGQSWLSRNIFSNKYSLEGFWRWYFSLFFFVRLLSISMCNLTERNLFENLKFITEFVTKLIGFDILNVICILILVLNLNSFFHGSMIFKALKHSSKIRDLCSMTLPEENTTKFAVQMKIWGFY